MNARNRTASSGRRRRPPKVKVAKPKVKVAKLSTQMLAVTGYAPDPDGGDDIPVMVADVIIDSVRRNMSVTEACVAADVERETYYWWKRRGAEVSKERAAMAEGTIPKVQITPAQEAFWWFHREIEKAKAVAEQRLVHSLHAVATGDGLTQKTVTRKVRFDEDGTETVVEETTKESDLLPNAQALEWILARRFRERWGSTDTLEVTGAGGGPVEVRHTHTVDGLTDLIGEVRKRMHGTIDARLAEPPQLPDHREQAELAAADRDATADT